jgi:hypothetical protein
VSRPGFAVVALPVVGALKATLRDLSALMVAFRARVARA